MKKIIILMVLLTVVQNFCQERRLGVLTRAQLHAQRQPEDDQQLHEWRTSKKQSGVRTLLEYVPMCAIGASLYFNSLYRLRNFEDKCWVQPVPSITPEMCDLLKQLACGGALCIASSGCFGKGCNDLCESKICNEDNCCSECCTICMQECCWLLGMNRNT